MHTYVFRCVLYTFFDVILCNFDVHPEILSFVDLLLHLPDLPLGTPPWPIGIFMATYIPKCVFMYIQFLWN